MRSKRVQSRFFFFGSMPVGISSPAVKSMVNNQHLKPNHPPRILITFWIESIMVLFCPPPSPSIFLSHVSIHSLSNTKAFPSHLEGRLPRAPRGIPNLTSVIPSREDDFEILIFLRAYASSIQPKGFRTEGTQTFLQSI